MVYKLKWNSGFFKKINSPLTRHIITILDSLPLTSYFSKYGNVSPLCFPHWKVWSWSFFLAFLQSQMRYTGSFNNLTMDSRSITNHRTLLTKPSNQNFIVFSRKHKPLSLSTKLWFSCCSWPVGPWHTSWQQSLTPNPAFPITGPFAGETPRKPLAFGAVPKWVFWYCLSRHALSHHWLQLFLEVWRAIHLPILWAL